MLHQVVVDTLGVVEALVVLVVLVEVVGVLIKVLLDQQQMKKHLEKLVR